MSEAGAVVVTYIQPMNKIKQTVAVESIATEVCCVVYINLCQEKETNGDD